MQNTNELRHHIGSVEQTKKITNAMNLIATARLKKVMQHIEYNSRYFNRVQRAMKEILMSPHPVEHPYLVLNTGKKRAYIVIAGDKGMVGSYNSSILDFAYEELKQNPDFYLVTIGIIATEYFTKKGIKPDSAVAGLSQDPSLYNARDLVFDIINHYDEHDIRSVYVIFTEFNRSAMPQPTMRRILPIRIHDYENVELNAQAHDMVYVPSAMEVFSQLVPQYLIGIMFGALVQSYASEQFARMNSMSSATQNADDLLKKLKIQYNIARQSAITQEISEISSAAELMLGDKIK